MNVFHLITEKAIPCQAFPLSGACERPAVVCTQVPPVSFFYGCEEHTEVTSRAECLDLASVLLAGAGIRTEAVRNDPYAIQYGKQKIPGFSYWCHFYLPASTTPVLSVELWGPRDGNAPDLLNALAAFCYDPFSTEEEDDFREESSPADFDRWFALHQQCEAFVETWQGMLDAVQRMTGTGYDLTDFLMTTVRRWA